jgi:tetratricopeptide (TPR) repeat protein
VNGLRTLNKRKPAAKPAPTCVAADTLFEGGRLVAARKAYEGLSPKPKCATSGVAAVKEVESLCDRGDALADVHRVEDASKAFTSALEKNPRAPCAKDGVKDLGKGWLARLLDGFISSLDDILALLGLLLAALFVFLMLGWIKPLRPCLLRIVGVRRLLGPRLALDLDDAAAGGKLGPPMEARIRETLQSFRAHALDDGPLGEYDLDVVPAAEQFAITVGSTSVLEGALKQAREANDHMKLVGAVLDLLYAALPIQRFTLAGVLESASAGAAAATLTLEADARLESATKLRGRLQSAEVPDQEYLDLSAPMAVWAQYEIVRVLDPGSADPNDGISNALLRQALDWAQVGDDASASASFEAAVAVDPKNWAAQVLLAIDQATGTGIDYDLAIQILEDALAEMTGSANG